MHQSSYFSSFSAEIRIPFNRRSLRERNSASYFVDCLSPLCSSGGEWLTTDCWSTTRFWLARVVNWLTNPGIKSETLVNWLTTRPEFSTGCGSQRSAKVRRVSIHSGSSEAEPSEKPTCSSEGVDGVGIATPPRTRSTIFRVELADAAM